MFMLLHFSQEAAPVEKCTLVRKGEAQGVLLYQRTPSLVLAETILDFQNHILSMSGTLLPFESKPKMGSDCLVLCLVNHINSESKVLPSSFSIEIRQSIAKFNFAIIRTIPTPICFLSQFISSNYLILEKIRISSFNGGVPSPIPDYTPMKTPVNTPETVVAMTSVMSVWQEAFS